MGLSELSPVKAAVDRDGQLVAAMEYYALGGAYWESLRALWLRLPEHPGLIAAISSSNVPPESIVLRYAALTGNYWFTAEVAPELARFGAELADVYRVICAGDEGAEWGRLLEPLAKIDVCRRLRIGFKGASGWTVRMAPEIEHTWPRCDQRAIVFMLGEVVSDHIMSCRDRSLWSVIDRCRHPKPSKRFQSIDELHAAFAKLARSYQQRSAEDIAAWTRIEAGLGWLEHGSPERTLDAVVPFLDHAMFGKLARSANARATAVLAEQRAAAPLAWLDTEAEIRQLDAQGAHEEACGLLAKVMDDPTHQVAIDAMRARVHLALHQTTRAIDFARRVLRADASRTESRDVLLQALLRSGNHHEALVEIDALIARAPEDAALHYKRGKVLLALSRLPEARDAFDRACTLSPMMVEAMLLRREVDRCMASGRRYVGAQGPITFDIPPSLAALRDVLINGPASDAIAALAQPSFADDPDAQLVRARVLVFDRQLAAALELYDRLAQRESHRHAALVGKASTLLASGQLEPALALFDQLCSEQPHDRDASEGRVRALEQAGRTDDATAEYRRFSSSARRAGRP